MVPGNLALTTGQKQEALCKADSGMRLSSKDYTLTLPSVCPPSFLPFSLSYLEDLSMLSSLASKV